MSELALGDMWHVVGNTLYLGPPKPAGEQQAPWVALPGGAGDAYKIAQAHNTALLALQIKNDPALLRAGVRAVLSADVVLSPSPREAKQPPVEAQEKPKVSIVMTLSEQATLVIYMDGSVVIEAVADEEEEPAALLLTEAEGLRLAATLTLWYSHTPAAHDALAYQETKAPAAPAPDQPLRLLKDKTVGELMRRFPGGFSIGPGPNPAVMRVVFSSSRLVNIAHNYAFPPPAGGYQVVELVEPGEIRRPEAK